CLLCKSDAEFIIHILRDCHQAWAFWNSFPPPIQSNLFYDANLTVWLQVNCTSHQLSSVGIPWSTLFTFGVWCLWLRCNRVIFKNQHNQKPLMVETVSKASEFAFLGVNERHRHSLTVM
ncbi:putative ribonuclease h protein, partial [Quercus suber]